MKKLRNKTAAITGAASGIGRALAHELAAEGCHLSLADIDQVGLEVTAREVASAGVRVTTTVLDVADRDQVARWAAQTVRDHGSVNLVFNNAGVAQSGTVLGNSYDDYAWVIDINLWGVIHGTKEFLPYLVDSGDGHIVNISSVFGLQAQPTVSAYNASKFAVRGFTESLRQELDIAGNGVSATCVHPGGIKTNIVKSSRQGDSMQEVFADPTATIHGFEAFLRTSPETAAKAILRGVRNDSRRVLIGLDAQFLDLEQRILPTQYQRINTMVMGTLVRLASRVTPRTTTSPVEQISEQVEASA